MSDDEIPDYRSKRETCLAVHGDEIMKLRAKRWPYREILARLDERHQVKVAYSTLREFCIRRKITKSAPGWTIRKPISTQSTRENEDSAPDLETEMPRKKLTLKVNKNS